MFMLKLMILHADRKIEPEDNGKEH